MNEGSTWTLTYVELFDLIMESSMDEVKWAKTQRLSEHQVEKLREGTVDVKGSSNASVSSEQIMENTGSKIKATATGWSKAC